METAMNNRLQFEQLENRALLAVSVTTGKQGLLSIVGDSAGDVVEVDGTGAAGQVNVYVNGSYEGTFDGIKTIKANLKGGDDELHLSAIHIGGAVSVDMGGGEDLFDLDTQSVAGGEGGQAFSGNVFIGGSVICKMGGNAGDNVECDTAVGGEGLGITIGNNVTLAGTADAELDGAGTTYGAESEDIRIGGFLKVSLNGSGDADGDDTEVLLNNVNVGGTTILNGSAIRDRIVAIDSSFARRVAVTLGAGDDKLDLDAGAGSANLFSGPVVADFGAGTDTLDDQPGNIFLVPPVGKNGPEIII
jgi:hypothetical protein